MNNTNNYIAGVLTPDGTDDYQLRERGMTNNNSKENLQLEKRRQSVEDGMAQDEKNPEKYAKNNQDNSNDNGSLHNDSMREKSHNDANVRRDTSGLNDDKRAQKRTSISSVTFANDVDIISDNPNGNEKRRSTNSDRLRTSTPIPKDEDNKDGGVTVIKSKNSGTNNKKNLILQRALDNLVLEDSGIVNEQDITISDNENNEQNQESVT